jgi:hypothetical protein
LSDKATFIRLSQTRLEDAKALLQAGRFAGAYYLAGYALEAAIKAVICQSIMAETFPPSKVSGYYTHSLPALAETAKLLDQVTAYFGNGTSPDKWKTVVRWS